VAGISSILVRVMLIEGHLHILRTQGLTETWLLYTVKNRRLCCNRANRSFNYRFLCFFSVCSEESCSY